MFDILLTTPWLTGLITLPWYGYILVALALTHVTIVSVTLYLHRHQAHRALDLHPVVAHLFRFWLWLTTGMVTREWVAVHRKHHAKCETPEDPHSPQVKGIGTVLWQGAELYQVAAAQPELIAQYSHGTPDDGLERHLYRRHPVLGVSLLLILQFLLFGFAGLAIWAVQMLWIPFWAAGVINGVGHWGGYRNFETSDASRNIVPWGLLVGGEELHNNHHAFASSARFSNRWWELDLGWGYIRLLKVLGLARVKKLAPRTVLLSKEQVDLDTVRAVVLGRLQVMADYARRVVWPVLRQEGRARLAGRFGLRQARRLLVRDPGLLDARARGRLEQLLACCHSLRTVYQFRQQLQAVWGRQVASHEQLRIALQDWCARAEATGIQALEEFARRLRGYGLQPAG
ncbi:MAG TPA: fatty acid desaturase [Gammaproteobacteria bacterium]